MAKKREMRHGRIHVPYLKEDKSPSLFFIAATLAIVAPVGVFFALKRIYNSWCAKKNRDFLNYAAIIGELPEISIAELCAKTGKTVSLVISDLQQMIEKGYLGQDAYIDRARELLMIIPGYQREEQEIPRTETVYEGNEEVPTPESPQPQWEEDQFEEKLRQIRELNDEIDDEEVSRRIDRIGELMTSIFYVMREKPERMDEVRKFMNYYLPTTFKLLRSYALMEKQSYQGENIIASRQKIEQILDTLIQAFEQQQDRLFRTEAMDVEADIEVLETMMAKDGLVFPKGTHLRASGR